MDLPDRLRGYAYNVHHMAFPETGMPMLLEAAKEIEKLHSMNELLKREVLAASTSVRIGGREMVVHPIVKAEIERLRQAAVDALARLAKGAPGWGVAKDILRLALSDKPLQ